MSNKMENITKTRNKRIRDENTVAQNQAELTKKLSKNIKVTSKETDKDVMLSPKDYYAKNDSEVKRILNSKAFKNLDVAGKTAFVNSINAKLAKKNAQYESIKSAGSERAIKLQDDTSDRQHDANMANLRGKLAIARAEIIAGKKVNENTRKLEDLEFEIKQENLKYKKAQTYKIQNS